MATVTGLTAAAMQAIVDATIATGYVDGDDLKLVTTGGSVINAGNVRGLVGPAGGGFEICTSLTQPSYSPAEAGKAIFETDTLLVRVWTGTRFRVQEVIICTSATRPVLVADDAGTKIIETDSGLEFTWTGSSYILSNSAVASFADIGARASEWSSPADGMLSHLVSSPGNLWMAQSGEWLSVGVQPGVALPWIGDAAPLNWLLMYGQTLINCETLYPRLWANASSTWKSGSNLIIPDMRGRIPVGKDNMGGTPAGRITSTYAGFNGTVLGAAGGDQRQQQHNHTQVAHAHEFNMYSGYVTGLSGTSGPDGLTLPGNYSGFTGTNSKAPTINNYGAGNSQNVQPSIVLNWILKIV